MNVIKVCILLSFMCFGMTTVLDAQLIQNGSFESASVDPGDLFVTLLAPSIAIDNWVLEGGSIELISSAFWDATDGTRSIDLSGSTGGTISQTFATEVDSFYTLTFDLAGNPGGGPSIKTVVVTVGDTSSTYTFDITGRVRQDMGWEGISLDFKATESATKLSFQSLTNTVSGPALDNVSVVKCLDCNSTVSPIVVSTDTILLGTCVEKVVFRKHD